MTGLIVAGGGFQGLPMLRALQALGARTVVADSLRHNPNAYEADVYAIVPPVADRAALRDELRRLCRVWSVDIVFPTTDRDLPIVAELAPELRDMGVVVAAPPASLVAEWQDKLVLFGALEAAGLPVLPFCTSGTTPSVFPQFGKPRRGWGAHGVVTANDAAEYAAQAAADREHSLLWQPKLAEFREWSVDFAIDERGVLSPLVARERLRTSAGFALVSRVEPAAPVHEVSRRTARWLAERGVCGVVNVQILEEPSGAQWVNDVNLRPGTSSGAALAAGVNFAAFMLGKKALAEGPSGGMFVRTLHDRFVPLLAERRITAVALDLDDCLIDQKAWMDEKLALLLGAWPEIAPMRARAAFEAAARQLIDEGPWDRLLELAARRSGIDESLVPVLIGRWRKAHPAAAEVYPDAAALVHALRNAGIRLAIVTDNPPASQKQKLDHLPFRSSIDAVVLTEEVGAPKPSPRGYAAAAAQLGVPAREMIAIGDSPWRDALGALAAGYSAAIVVPRRGAMGNPARARFARAHPEAAANVLWAEDLYAVPHMLGLPAVTDM